MSAIVDCEWLSTEKANGRVKVVDASYALKPGPNHEEFKAKYYGKFDELMNEKKNSDYVEAHIPDAVHFNFDVAYYPAEFEKFGLYPAELFQEYVRRLGIEEGDHVVLYSRGPGAGMVFAARAWWTLKAYGHNSVSVLNGGFDAWKNAGKPVAQGGVTVTKISSWTAKPLDSKMLIRYEEMAKKDAEGESIFDICEQINYLDARAKDQYSGAAPLGLPAKHATGSHVRGAKNVPLSEFVTPTGLKPKEEVHKVLSSAGHQPEKETIVACNGGVQAALVYLALHEAGVPAKLYNGSMYELANRASHLINGKPSESK